MSPRKRNLHKRIHLARAVIRHPIARVILFFAAIALSLAAIETLTRLSIASAAVGAIPVGKLVSRTFEVLTDVICDRLFPLAG